MKLETPQIVQDVYRDLRDRRLLIPCLALLVALVAVPMLLSRSSEPAAPPLADAGAAAAEDGAATQPAVITETVSVRDYEKRLDDLKSKNPFTEHFTLPVSDGAGLVDPSLSTGLEDTGGGGATLDAGTSTPPADTTIDSDSGTSSTSPSQTTSGSEPPEIEARYYTWRIDVNVGKVGETKERNGVSQLSLLPSQNKPVVVFLGISESGKEAVFAVSDDVTAVTGSGRCAPSNSNCTYFSLGEHEYGVFDYSVDGERYRLQLRKIRSIQIDQPDQVGKF